MARTLKDITEIRAKYAELQNRAAELARQAGEASHDLGAFFADYAVREVDKPWEICGAEDSWHPRHPEGHPEYDEDDLVAAAQCQLPKGHGRWHQEWSEDGRLWAEWSG